MFHFQSSVNDWPRAVAKLPKGSLIKAVKRPDILRDAKLINPGVTTMLRHHGGPQNIFWGDFEANKQLAADFFETFIDGSFREQYARHVDLVQEWNEYLASSHTGMELQQRLTWAEACAWVWKHVYRVQPEYSHIRLVLVSAPVGNDIHRQFAEIALAYDCVLSYHAYDKFIDGKRDPLSWRYHCGRWAYMEEAWGLKPDWLFGETGPYAGVVDGWRADKVLGGNRDAYVAAVRTWVRELAQTSAYQEGRIKGFALFTTGKTEGGWDKYYTEQPELDMLAEMLAQEWKPGTGVVLPPPPAPKPEPKPPASVLDVVTSLPKHPTLRYGTRPLSAVEHIIIHHSDAPSDRAPEAIAAYHVNTNDWPGIGYHFYILGDGAIYQTNRLTTHSYHAGTWNFSSVGVCLAGAFTTTTPSQAQIDSARFLLEWLSEVFPDADILAHREVNATQCPGDTWQLWFEDLTMEPDWKQIVWNASLEEQQKRGITLNPEHGLEMLVYDRPGYVPVHREITVTTPNGDRYGLMAAEHLGGTQPRIVLAFKRPWNGPAGVQILTDPVQPQGFRFRAWPTNYRVITQQFGANPQNYREYGLPGHEGVDIRAFHGTPIYAVAPGKVTFAGSSGGAYGIYAIIDHGDGWTTAYAHCERLLVVAGQNVEAGQQIARADSTGNSDGAHLHISLKRAGHTYVDGQGVSWPRNYHDPTPFLEAL